MKKIVLLLAISLVSITGFAQIKVDLGLKLGANFSKLSLNLDDYSADSRIGTQFGAFGRFGFGRFFAQPELLYSLKGGEISLNNVKSALKYSSFDVPVLLGFRAIKGKVVDLHFVAGPVFSGITSKNIEGSDLLDKSFYENHYFSVQYGLGVDVLFMTFDARMENGLGTVYSQNNVDIKNNSFILSVGFKIL